MRMLGAMEPNMMFRRTRTSDSGDGACVFNAIGRIAIGAPIGVFLRHTTIDCWCGAGGDWLGERGRAIRFATNIDALVYCQALNLRGVLVAFDEGGREIYQLNVNKILDVVAADPAVRWFFGPPQ